MIREATTRDRDIAGIITLGRQFYQDSGLEEFAPIDEISARVTVRNMINGDGAVIFIDEDQGRITGLIGGVLALNVYNFQSMFAEEKFWYVAADQRGGTTGIRLLNTFTAWARQRGATYICYAAIKHLNFEQVSRIYVKKGLKNLEEHFIGRL